MGRSGIFISVLRATSWAERHLEEFRVFRRKDGMYEFDKSKCVPKESDAQNSGLEEYAMYYIYDPETEKYFQRSTGNGQATFTMNVDQARKYQKLTVARAMADRLEEHVVVIDGDGEIVDE